ncbi:hypothetical protein A9D46_02725 [Photobacterium damselae subsp. damselae]|uniref:diguanylate cyclase regulator RdcB family protein n=1 Tax=Photobacterium damselae TaxID=38293 RepID=UPI00084AEECF|nr:diguanylate cyclase regulator RdcB family protein [Photobacterium damselae]NVO60403.1 chemotaxis protein [Photobacterium damselae subsp. damselae]OEC83019.1 hypothetical protein A9D46_02725 [Photobacterium damselae subsp. damselae]
MSELGVSKETLSTLTCLPEKFIVDFANGIDVSRDHQRMLKDQSFGSRLLHTFNGKNTRRQNEINQNIIEGLDSSLIWLSELSESVAKSNLALAKVNERVNSLLLDTAKIAHFSATTRDQLEVFALKTSEHLIALEANIKRIEIEQHGMFHLDQVMTRWQAGGFNGFTLAGRCYAVLEELRWGAYGDLLRQSSSQQASTFIESLQNKAIVQMAKDAQVTTLQRIDTREWLVLPKTMLKDGQEALSYMGDWCYEKQHPIVHTVTQPTVNMSCYMPRLCSSERLVSGLVEEVFEAEVL